MSARIAPEPVSIAVSTAAQFAPRHVQPTRPIESVGSTSADPKQDRAPQEKYEAENKAQPSERPPGKDPSIPPQTLFDASLIAAEFKPSTELAREKESPHSEPSTAPEKTRPQHNHTVNANAHSPEPAANEQAYRPTPAPLLRELSRDDQIEQRRAS